MVFMTSLAFATASGLLRGDLRGQLHALGDAARSSGDDPADQSPLGRRRRVEQHARHDELGRAGDPDHPGEQGEHPAAAHLPEIQVAVTDAGRLRRRWRSRS